MKEEERQKKQDTKDNHTPLPVTRSPEAAWL